MAIAYHSIHGTKLGFEEVGADMIRVWGYNPDETEPESLADYLFTSLEELLAADDFPSGPIPFAYDLESDSLLMADPGTLEQHAGQLASWFALLEADCFLDRN